VLINLNENEDEFLVFESINSKGKDLSSADLIKNFIIMQLENKTSSNDEIDFFKNRFIIIFNNFPKPEEHLIDFYRQMYAIKDGKLYSKNGKSMYYAIKKHLLYDVHNLSDNIKDFYNNAILYKYIFNLSYEYWAWPLINANKMNFYSIIHLIIKYNSKIENGEVIITNQDNINVGLKFLSKLVVARTLCSFGRVEGNRSYASISSKLYKELENGTEFKIAFKKYIADVLNESVSNDRMPKWDEIINIDAKRDLYSSLRNNLKWILLSIEKYLSKNNHNMINNDSVSIEHIFSQKPKQNSNDIYEIKEWTHTLGNLTITKINSDLSNNEFKSKQKINSDRDYFKINKIINNYEIWGIDEIKDRAKYLLELIKKIWFIY